MKFNIPPPGTLLVLSETQSLAIKVEKRNKQFLRGYLGCSTTEDGKTLMVSFPKGYELTVAAIQAGKLHRHTGDRITFTCEGGRFWVALDASFDFEIGPIEPPKPFFLQNRYQDGGWDNCGLEYDELSEALADAAKCAGDSIRYGMVRVIHRQSKDTQQVIITIPAGGYR